MVGDRIRMLREDNEMTQEQLGFKLSLSASTIGMYEQNRRIPDIFTLEKIANILDVTVDYLLGRKESKEIETLKNLLIKNGYMKPREDLSDDELDKLIKFAVANKEFLKK